MGKKNLENQKLKIDNNLLQAFSQRTTQETKIRIEQSNESPSAQDLALELLEKAKHSITSTEHERMALSKISDALSNEQVVEIDINLLDSFEDHTYKVEPDEAESMKILMRSITEQGIIHPIVITPAKNGRYQVISGHRRTRACTLLKYQKVPCILKTFNDDDTDASRKKRELMIEANLQRGGMKPSEKARSYKMKVDNMKRQGFRSDLIEHGDDEKKLSDLDKKANGSTYLQVALQEGDSRSEIYRYLRLNELNEDLLFLVDTEIIPVRTAAELSFLSEEYQKELYAEIRQSDIKPTYAQAVQMKKAFQAGTLQAGDLKGMLGKTKVSQGEKYFVSSECIRKYVPRGLSSKQISAFIEKALKFYSLYENNEESESSQVGTK